MNQTGGTESYRDFFIEQGRRVGALQQRRLAFAIVGGVILLVLLFWLRSPWYVAFWVALLYGVIYFGLNGLQDALRVTGLALVDLEGLARFLDQPRSAEDLRGYVRGKIKPDDSNVPEALFSLCSGQPSGESIRAASNSSFSQPASQLSVAYFLRTALVLAGLFGTVLFFALELGDPTLLSGNVGRLLPGLRGALASTLTGILGSLALGYLGSNIEQVIDRSIWETESLISGPFVNALSVIPARGDVLNELQLWQSLITEVALFRNEAASTVKKLGDDVSAYTSGLAALEQRLAGMPAMHVPPELGRLNDVIGTFRQGMELLDRNVERLVTTVATVNLTVPTQTLQELRLIRQDGGESRGSIEAKLGALAGGLSGGFGAMASDLDAVRSAVAPIPGALGSIQGRLGEVDEHVAALNSRMSHVHEGVTRLDGRTVAIAEGVDKLLAAGRDVVLPPPGGVDGRKWEGADAIAVGVEEMRSSTEVIKSTAAHLNESLSRVAAYQKDVKAIGDGLSGIQQWSQRAAHAPLLKLLLMPLWPGRRAADANGA